MAFKRPEHNISAELLASMKQHVLIDSKCYFGGGTAIVLTLDEYRQTSTFSVPTSLATENSETASSKPAVSVRFSRERQGRSEMSTLMLRAYDCFSNSEARGSSLRSCARPELNSRENRIRA